VQNILDADDLILDAVTRELLSGFLEEPGEGRLRFRTAMVRDVAYEGLSFRRRRELHLRAAAAIEEESVGHPDDAADQLAMHYSLGGNHERTWHYARIAADRSMRSYANVEAATQYERALESARHIHNELKPETEEAWIGLGQVRERAGLFDGALDAYRGALRSIGDDPIAQANVLLKRAIVRWLAGQYSMALSEATRATHLVEESKSDEALGVVAVATAFSAHVKLRQEKPHDALVWARRAVDEASAVGEMRALARAYGVIAWANLTLDDSGALEYCQKALQLYESLDDLAGQSDMSNNLGVLAYYAGRWGDALTYYESSREGAERIGNVVDVGFADMNIGEMLLDQGRLDEAEERLNRAVRVLRSSKEIYSATFAEVHLSRVLIERGDLARAESLLRSVWAEARASGFTAREIEANLFLADCAIRRGEPVEALSLLDHTMLEAGSEASAYVLIEMRLRGSALVAQGDFMAASEVTRKGLAGARDRRLDYDVAKFLMLKERIVSGLGGEIDPEERVEARSILERLEVVTHIEE
jgi:tetratricopeptide (TPR) repeat protein